MNYRKYTYNKFPEPSAFEVCHRILLKYSTCIEMELREFFSFTLFASLISLMPRYFFNKEGDFNNLTSAAYHKKTHLLVTGFASGIFHLHELPDFNLIHSLR